MKAATRSSWRARPPRSRTTTSWSRRTEFVVHHSEGPPTQSIRSIQDFHMDTRGWSDIGYNFLVDVAGRIYEGRGWLVVGAHAEGHNTTGIGVCFIGRDGDVTAAAKNSIRALYDEARRRAGHPLLKRGHGQLSGNNTDCPGKTLRAWVSAGMPATGSPPAPPPKPPRPGTKAPPFPLPAGHWFGPESADRRNHSGYWPADRSHIHRLQQRFKARGWGISVTGRYDARTVEVVRAFQAEKGLRVDGLTGKLTWAAAWTEPVTR